MAARWRSRTYTAYHLGGKTHVIEGDCPLPDIILPANYQPLELFAEDCCLCVHCTVIYDDYRTRGELLLYSHDGELMYSIPLGAKVEIAVGGGFVYRVIGTVVEACALTLEEYFRHVSLWRHMN